MDLLAKSISRYELPKDLGSWRKFFVYINRKLDHLGFIAMGRTAPNPPVGAILYFIDTNNSKLVIICGSTRTAGKEHAEIVLLNYFDSYLQKHPEFKNSPIRIAVTLEPCSHIGKTPACSQRMLKYKKLKKIYIKNPDPNLKHSSIVSFRKNRIAVVVSKSNNGDKNSFLNPGVLDGFFERILKQRSRLHVKVAMSSDNCMGIRHDRLRITQKELGNIAMRLRFCLDAVFVGTGTVLSDQPGLEYRKNDDCRDEISNELTCEGFFRNFFADRINKAPFYDEKEYQPVRMFLPGRYFPGYHDFLEKQKKLTITTGKQAEYYVLNDHYDSWKNLGMNPVLIDSLPNTFWTRLQRIWCQKFNTVLVEAGHNMIKSLIANGLSRGDFIWILKSYKSSEQLLKEQNKTFPIIEKIFVPEQLFKAGHKILDLPLDEGVAQVYRVE